MKNIRKIISIIIELSIVLFVISGIASTNGFMAGSTTFLYFTIQSNIWIGCLCLVIAIIQIVEFIMRKKIIKNYIHILKLIFTSAITLTGVVYCFVLVPTAVGFNPWNISNTILHVVTPALSIIDFFLIDHEGVISKKQVFLVLTTPLYYVIFATICYFANVNFGGGNNYPYFFFNYASPAGFFGFSDVTPNFMGSFWWLLIILSFMLGVGYLYRYLAKKLNNILNK